MATADATIRIVAEDKTADAFGKLDSRMGKAQATLSKFTKGLAAVGALAGLAKLGLDAIKSADEIQKLSVRLGASTEALSEYQHVADISGVSFTTLTMGLQRMTRRVAEAALGTGEAVKALEELGLSAADLNAMPLDVKFETIADSLNGLESDADKVRLAMKLFDSEGVALIQTMSEGSAGIQAMREEARALGISLSTDTANAAAAANDELAKLGTAFDGVLLALLPVIIPLVEGLAAGLMLVAAGLQKAIEWIAALKAPIDGMIQGFKDAGASAAEMKSQVVGSIGGMKDEAMDRVNSMVDGIKSRFRNMWDSISNRSIVPDMVKDVVGWFGVMKASSIRETEAMRKGVLKEAGKMGFSATGGITVSGQGNAGAVRTPSMRSSAIVAELRALRKDLANVVATPIVGAVTRGQLATAGAVRH